MMSQFDQMRMSRRSALGFLCAGTAATLLAACTPATPAAAPTAVAAKPAATSAPAAAAGPLDIVTVGATAIIASAGLFVAQEKGFFKDEGLDVQITIVAGSNDTLPLVATGKLDVANNAVTAFMVNAVVEGVNMKWVAGQASYTPKHGTLGLVVRKDLYDSGAIRELKDLKGKKIAVPIVAGGGAIVLDRALNTVGLTKADVDLSEMAIPNMPAALQNGALDVVMPAEPIVVNMAAQGIGVIMMYSDQMYPGMEATQYMYSPQFASERPAVGVRFMAGLLKGARAYNDAFAKGTNKAEILDILIKNTSVKDPALYEKMQLSELNANGSLDARNMQEQVDWLVKYGFVKQQVDVSKLIDPSFTEKALQRIGKV